MLLSIWEDFLKTVYSKKDENPIVYSILRQLQPTELTDNKIILSCENQGVHFFMQKRLPQIEKYLFEFFKKKVSIEIVVTAKKKKEDAPLLQFQPSIDDVFKKSGLNGKYSFDSFAVSPTNQVAYAAAIAVSDRLGRAYNPLFLYGGVGVGKTHIAQSIARKILEIDPKKKVYFCPGDQFTNELIEGIKEKATSRFRRKYRHLDLLIVDDVQFIAGKNTIQEEFFHTFNAVVSSGGQIILTSDKPPSAIKNLEDRLRSRFSGGLIVDVQEPDFELRTAIILIKAREKNIEIDMEAAKLISEQVTDSRALEGTLLSLYAKTLGNGDKVDLETIEDFFRGHKKKRVKKVYPEDVIKAVCSYYNIKISHLKSAYRSDAIALPRQIAMFLLRKELGLKYDEVAFHLKRKDHTTIMHGVEKITRMLARDEGLKQELDRIKSLLELSTSYSQ